MMDSAGLRWLMLCFGAHCQPSCIDYCLALVTRAPSVLASAPVPVRSVTNHPNVCCALQGLSLARTAATLVIILAVSCSRSSEGLATAATASEPEQHQVNLRLNSTPAYVPQQQQQQQQHKVLEQVDTLAQVQVDPAVWNLNRNVTAATAAATAASDITQASQKQQQWSGQQPLINGWSNLQTSATITYTWSQSLYPLTPTSFSIPWGWGTAIAKARASLVRSVTSARYTFSGNLAITNSDPIHPMWLNRIQLQCYSGTYLDLPCGGGGWGFGGLQIGAGQVSYCYVNDMSVQASWGNNGRQVCKVVVTTASGVQSNSGDFILDFNSPTINNQANNCISVTATCSLSGTPYYNPTIGGLPSNQVYCDSSANMDFDVAVNGGFTGDGRADGSCRQSALVNCYTQGVYQSTIGTPNNPGGSNTAVPIQIQLTPTDCPKPPATPVPPAPVNPGPPPGFQDRPEPQLSITVTKTYIAGAYLWSVASSVNPNTLQVFTDSSATARYAINVTRTLASNPAAKYLVEGVITMYNPGSQALVVTSVSAVLPWGTATAATCQDFSLPGTLNPHSTVRCSYRLTHDYGPQASSVSAQAVLQTQRTPVQSPTAAQFNLKNADMQWSTGACTNVIMAFSADPKMSLALAAGGTAPAFAGGGASPTQLCGDTAFDFAVQFTIAKNFPAGVTKVLSKVTVSPISSTQESVTASSTEEVTVLQWPATWGPRVQTMQHIRTADIPNVAPKWLTFDF